MRKLPLKSVITVVAAIVALGGLYWGVLQWDRIHVAKASADEPDDAARVAGLISLSKDRPNTLRFTAIGLQTVGIETVEVRPAPPPEPLKLPGSILLDPNRLVRIHSRFPGELVSLGTVSSNFAAPASASAKPRQLRFGDHVERGQIIAVVWSKDIGEKKSELVDALSKQVMDKLLLTKLEAVEKGIVPEARLQEARRNYEADLIAVARAERTLRSWRMTEDEIKEVRDEAQRIHNREAADPNNARAWAETEVRSPIDGIVVEKNFNVGDLIDTAQDLFKIADLNRVQVLANAFEEDLPRLKTLRPDQRNWHIDVKSDPHDLPLSGTFDTIGSIIDPAQHAGAVMGWVDNPDGRFKIGQFVTATIALPADPDMVVVPTTCLIEDGTCAKVFVESNAERHEFTCRKVAVARRQQDLVYVRTLPAASDPGAGDETLKAGDRVVRSGALELQAELSGLQAAARGH